MGNTSAAVRLSATTRRRKRAAHWWHLPHRRRGRLAGRAGVHARRQPCPRGRQRPPRPAARFHAQAAQQ